MEVVINEDLKKQVDEMKDILDLIEKTRLKADALRFITTREFAELSGWSEPTAQKLFNRDDFPSCDFGKEKIAELSAVIQYFSVPRRKNAL